MYDSATFPNLPLAHGVSVADRPDRHLHGVCRCGATGVVDPAPWIAAGLGGQSLRGFAARLKCLACGADGIAALEVWYRGVEPDGAFVVMAEGE
jgi:hypothetical protein